MNSIVLINLVYKLMHRYNLIILFICASLLSCSKKAPEEAVKSAVAMNKDISAEAYIVKEKPLNESLKIPGSLLAYEETEIHPEVSGKIVSLNIKEGNNVTKGTVLAKIYDEDLQAQLRKIKVQLQIAENNEKRQSELLTAKAIGQQEYNANILEVSNLKADIEILQTNIKKTQIIAPFTGRLGFRNISLGAYVTPQTVLTTLSQVDQLKLEFSLPEKYINLINVGEEVVFTTADAGKSFKAKIFATETTVEANTRSLKLRALVTQHDKRLTPGAFAEVKVSMKEKQKAITVPSESVIPQARNKKIIVYKNGKADFQIVTLGVRDSSTVEITSGLKTGDTIITTGLLFLKPGSKIKLTSIKN